MITKKIVIGLFAFTLSMAFVFSLPALSSEQKPIVLRLAHMYPETNPVGMAAAKFAKQVEEETDGKIKVYVFPAGQLGGEVENREALMGGTLDMCLNSLPTLSAYVPEVAMTDLPYFWRGPDHYILFWQSALGLGLIARYEAATGIKVISTNWLTSMRHVLAKKPVSTPADMNGVKIRVTQGFQHHFDGFLAMGATPVFMAFPEVYSALQQGVIDAMENPIADIYRSKFHEICKYLSLTGHIFNSRTVQISRNVWDKLTPETQTIMTKAADDAGEYHQMLNGLIKIEGQESPVDQVIEKMKKAGVTFIEPDKEAFAEKCRQRAHPKYIKKYKNGQMLYDQIQAMGK